MNKSIIYLILFIIILPILLLGNMIDFSSSSRDWINIPSKSDVMNYYFIVLLPIFATSYLVCFLDAKNKKKIAEHEGLILHYVSHGRQLSIQFDSYSEYTEFVLSNHTKFSFIKLTNRNGKLIEKYVDGHKYY